MADTDVVVGFLAISVFIVLGLVFSVYGTSKLLDSVFPSGAEDKFSYSSHELEPVADELSAAVDAVEEPVAKPVLNLQPNLEFVSATEYTTGDSSGSTIIKLTDWRGDYIDTDCYEQILYPNKTVYVDWVLMTYQSDYGNYYNDFSIPGTEGIYDQEVRCLVSAKNLSIGKGFHVGSLTEQIEDANRVNDGIMSIVS